MSKKSTRPTGPMEYAVIYEPWQRDGQIVSRHFTPERALTAARRSTQRFHDANPGSYGYVWTAAELDGDGWREVATAENYGAPLRRWNLGLKELEPREL